MATVAAIIHTTTTRTATSQGPTSACACLTGATYHHSTSAFSTVWYPFSSIKHLFASIKPLFSSTLSSSFQGSARLPPVFEHPFLSIKHLFSSFRGSGFYFRTLIFEDLAHFR